MDSVKTESKPQGVTKGPIEGIIIVDGRPQMERVDMPTISFTKKGLKRLQEHYKTKLFFSLFLSSVRVGSSGRFSMDLSSVQKIGTASPWRGRLFFIGAYRGWRYCSHWDGIGRP